MEFLFQKNKKILTSLKICSPINYGVKKKLKNFCLSFFLFFFHYFSKSMKIMVLHFMNILVNYSKNIIEYSFENVSREISQEEKKIGSFISPQF